MQSKESIKIAQIAEHRLIAERPCIFVIVGMAVVVLLLNHQNHLTTKIPKIIPQQSVLRISI